MLAKRVLFAQLAWWGISVTTVWQRCACAPALGTEFLPLLVATLAIAAVSASLSIHGWGSCHVPGSNQAGGHARNHNPCVQICTQASSHPLTLGVHKAEKGGLPSLFPEAGGLGLPKATCASASSARMYAASLLFHRPLGAADGQKRRLEG